MADRVGEGARKRGRRPNRISGNGPCEEFARDLVELLERQEPPLTRAALARKSRCAAGTVSKALAGNEIPTKRVLTALLGALGEDPGPWVERRSAAIGILGRTSPRSAPGSGTADASTAIGVSAPGAAGIGRELLQVSGGAHARRENPDVDHLVDRDVELGRIRDLLAGTAAGCGGTLVVRGDPGIGKTALLSRAHTMWGGRATSIRCTAIEADLAFSALSTVLAAFTDAVPELPEPQRRALLVSLELSDPEPGEPAPSRLALGLGATALLAAAAPLLVLLDDVQWMDEASASVLSFAVRRLSRKGVGVIVGLRTGSGCPMDLTGLPVTEPGPITDARARQLIRRDGPIDAERLESVVRHSGGNPLALREWGRLESGWDPADPTEVPIPLPRMLEAEYRHRLAPLPRGTRWALLVCAAGDACDGSDGVGALSRRQLDALEPAASVGLITMAPGRVVFTHPLIRSAVYQDATASRRRAAHALLARTLDPDGRADLRAWHRAHATLGTDAEVALALADVAARARRRGALGPARTAYLRAAQLTPAAELRAHHLVAAAICEHLAGHSDRAVPLLGRARKLSADPELRGEIERTNLQIRQTRAAPSVVFGQLVRAAAQLRESAPLTAGDLLATAASVGVMGGMVARALNAAREGDALVRTVTETGTTAPSVLHVHTLLMSGRPPADLRERLDTLLTTDPLVHGMEVFGFACMDLMWSDEHLAARRLLAHALRCVRDADASERLPVLVGVLAEVELRQGRWPQALANATESLTVADQLGQPAIVGYAAATLACVAAAQGRLETCENHAARALAVLEPRGYDGIATYAHLALAQSALCQDLRPVAAQRFVALRQRIERLGVVNPAVFPIQADLIEACLLVHRRRDAESALAAFARTVDRATPPSVKASLARCHALMAENTHAAQRYFSTAEDLYARVPDPYNLARTRLALGRRLRCEHPARAREHLAAALSEFDRLGATPWTLQTEQELQLLDR